MATETLKHAIHTPKPYIILGAYKGFSKKGYKPSDRAMLIKRKRIAPKKEQIFGLDDILTDIHI